MPRFDRRSCVLVAASALALLVLTLPAPANAAGLDYPESRRDKTVDDYHGTKVADPYRWLETDLRESEEVQSWIERQNAVTFGYLEEIPERDTIRRRLEQLWNYKRFSSPFKVAERYYYTHNDGLQNHSVLYALDSLDAEPRVLLDPNGWSEDGTTARGGLSFSDDGRYLAYARFQSGSDWRTWYVRDTRTGEDLPDRLEWVKFSGAAWTGDSKGFFYSRFDEPAPGATYQAVNENQKLYYHRIGTPQSEDVLVYQRPDHPDWGFGAGVTEDGRYLVISTWRGTDPKNRVTYKDLMEPYGMPIDLIDGFENQYSLVGNEGPVFYFMTDVDAPNRRLVAIDIRRPERESWREVIPESDNPLRRVSFVGNLLVASYLDDVTTAYRIFRTDGSLVRDVDLPGQGSTSGFGGKQTDLETFYVYSSFNRPPSIYQYDMITGKSELWRQATVDFDPDRYEVKQVFYESKDGTRVPMFLAHRKGIALDGSNPALLYGYGGFGASLTPYFSVTRLAWMEMGGVYAQANLRGGGEYGRKWHEAGKKKNKQNVFDDFIAAAEWLIDNGYTRSERLAIQGGSNGGLLVGAAMTQRPDLFGAALPAVGVMDMLRFHLFTAGRYWVDDYGTAEDGEMFPTLFAYSPYHNLRPGTKYPATLITTSDTDDRVVPAHSFKFAAALQHAQKGEAPVLIRIQQRAGHGGGKPTAMRIEEAADLWAFLVKSLGMALPSDRADSGGH